MERGERERKAQRGSHKENTYTKPLTRKTRVDFMSFYWSFRGPCHGPCGAQQALQFSYGEGQIAQ